jgi:adenosylcobinamide kinase/adenosylcobinamide-phosphate guanylyltransferase
LFEEMTMAHTLFITGGARSGKSRFAEELALNFGAPLGYLATARALDDEMKERIKLHQLRRGNEWCIIEEPLQLRQALVDSDGRYKAILVDCVTLWLSNLLLAGHENPGENIEVRIRVDVQHLLDTLGGMATPVIVVSNEVGMGIVPENRLARLFRDITGQTNQLLAAGADEVYAVFSGIPLKLK